jgi:DNA-binding NtrC family response regulator
MGSRILAVHDDPTYVQSMSAALQAWGHNVVTFDSPFPAWNALSLDEPVGALITRTRFPKVGPNGIALARWAHANHPGIRVFFLAPPALRHYVDGVGMLLAMPLLPKEAGERVCRILASQELYDERAR